MSKAPTLTFYGAAGEVTGSCTLLRTDHAQVLVDCGLFQGSPAQEERNTIPPAIDFAHLDAVVCTHAHIDHCGRLGMLPKLDYEGFVYCHEATAELIPRVLTSSASLQAVRLEEYLKGTAPEAVVLDPVPDPAFVALNKRTGPPPVLYARGHAEKAGRSVVGMKYGVWRQIATGVRVRLHDAGHIVGSASVELEVEHGARRIRVLFSGDLGPPQSGLFMPRGNSVPADVVIMESTTGARAPGATHANSITLEALVQDARQGGRMVVMPTFSVGRAQLLTYRLALLAKSGALGGMPVYLDSPMAARAAELCCGRPELLSEEVRAGMQQGHSPLDFKELFLLWSRKQSLKIAGRQEAGLVLAGSGFCDAGPVLHHLQQALPSPRGHIVFTGHVLVGSLAHALAHGAAKRVRINGQVMEAHARVSRIDGFSGHAHSAQLEEWLLASGHMPELLILNHGDGDARRGLGGRLQADLTSAIKAPAFLEEIQLS